MTYRGDPDEFDRDLRQTTDQQLEGTYSSLGPQHKCRYVRVSMVGASTDRRSALGPVEDGGLPRRVRR